MNIGLIRMRYTPYGGAEVFVSRFVDELLKRGHTCHIFANTWEDGKSEVKSQNPKLAFHKIRTFGPSFLRLLSFAINTFFAVKKINLDVIVSFDRTLYQDIYRAGDGCHREWLIQRNKSEVRRIIKKIITSLNPLHLTLLYLEKRLFKSKRLKFVIANSKRGKDEIIRHYKLPEEKIYVIYNGIDLRQFNHDEKGKIRAVYRERLGIKSETTLLFVGSGFERKGLRFLIEALGVLKDVGAIHELPLLKLVVVGKGQTKHYQDIAKRCGVDGDVQFVGPVKDVKGYYAAADIFVLPSIYEPFSNACLEAMASGLPVVTSRINGVSEILTDGKDGMIVNDPLNPKEVAEKIRPLLNEDVRAEAGKMAQMTVGGYTIEKNVESFLKLIEEIQ